MADHDEASVWRRLERTTLYESWWIELHVDRVALPDGRIIDHEVVAVPRDGVAAIVVDPERGALLIWRHRFITGKWGWEVPAGVIDPGEDVATAAARECLEETGWRPGPTRHLTSFHPSSGTSDQRFHIELATEAVHEGPPSDPNEAARVAWRSFSQVEADLAAGLIPDGLAQYGLVLGAAATGRPLRWPS